MSDAMRAETIEITGAGGDRIEAYLAQPLDRTAVGGVVVIHHMPGYDESTKEFARRFAHHGYLALCPNLYSREAPGASPDDAAATVRARGGVPDERLVGDIEGAANALRSMPASNGKVATIGYCSGGRQSFLSACGLPLQAAVDCYGGMVTGTPHENTPAGMIPLVHLTKNLSCPLLGLFGADDQFPSPENTAELAKALDEHDKEYEFHTYEGAGHGFFSPDRPSYRVEAANAGWQEIWTFFGRHLA
jgi:carboxymethylenebutenolidase